MRKVKGMIAICLLMSLMLSVLPFPSMATTSSDPFVITMLNTYFSAEPPPDDHEIYKMIEEETGAVFDTTWIPAAAYREKVTLALASGDLPMVINGKSETRTPIMLDAQRQGIFWELTDDVLAQCPSFLNKLDPKINNNLKVDGKLYALYEERPIGRSATVYRKDWLVRLGLEVPYTLEDYDKVIRAFAKADFDGNGKEDTGLFTTNGFIFPQLTMFALANGGVNTWRIEDGKFIHEVLTPEYQKTLNLFRQWYQDGLINKDFVALSATQDVFDAFQAQKTGIALCLPLDDSLKQAAVLALDPNAEVAVIPYLIDKNGKKFINGGTGHSGGFFFTKAAIPDKETLVRVLQVFDKIAEPEGRITDASVWGLEGRHFTLEDGMMVQTAAQKELNNNEVMNFVQYRVTFDHRASWDNAKVSQLQLDVINGWKENESMAVTDPALPLISETYVEEGTQLDNQRKDAIIKYIMGELDQEGFDAAIDQWNNDGGAKVAEEYTQAYALSIQ